MEDIEKDNQSRKEWLETRAAGIQLLGLKLEEPRSGLDSATLEGMSTIRHPLLLESSLRFQANARGELLPAAGPVKVRNDTPPRPRVPEPMPPPQTPAMPPPGGPPGGPPGMPPQMGHNGGPPLGGPQAPPSVPPPNPPQPEAAQAPPFSTANDTEELSSALETDMNHYLTAVATEYYPDTDRMLFYVGFGGQGFKKVYNCPLRQRPVSESVDAENLIVNDSANSLGDCGRITHHIKMRPSTLKRMQILGAYLDIEIPSAHASPVKNAVDRAKDEVQGINPQPQRPVNAEHDIYETYCELDIAGFEHKKGRKVTGLQCPYKVTIHKESRKVLEVRRNWLEDDKLCMPKQYFVEFPFVRALGFYGIGLVHIAGNTTRTLTAGWREMLDAGMFASFPGFIYAKGAGRQLTNQFRVPPGGGIGLDVGTGRLQDSVMPLPYKDPGAGFVQFMAHVEEVGQRVSGTAEVQVGEGSQEQPVGTTMALIEQATKVMDAVHKRLHAAQATEFKLLKDRFHEDPESFWRHNKKPSVPWQKEQFLKALDNANLVPVADPNNPTSLHRISKAVALKTLQSGNPSIYDPVAVDTRIMRIINIDPEGLFSKGGPAPPDPKMVALQQKAQADLVKAKMAELQLQVTVASKVQDSKEKAMDRASKEKIAQMQLELEQLRIIQERVIHGHDLDADQRMRMEELKAEQANRYLEAQSAHVQHSTQLVSDHLLHGQSIQSEHAKHDKTMVDNHLNRQVELRKIEVAKAAAKAKPATKAKKPSK